jgi:potassium-transporting ATPase KdpC subunit
LAKNILPALTALLIVGLLVAIVYPWAVETYGQLVFDHQLDGSLMANKGAISNADQKVRNVNDPSYFWGLPPISAPSYNSALPGEPKYDLDRAASTLSGAFQPDTPTPGVTITNHENPNSLPTPEPTPMKPFPVIPIFPIPTPGGSLKMDISPEAAQLQVKRIAQLRGMEPGVIQSLIRQYTEKQPVGVSGDPRVNVLKLNQALDRLAESIQNPSKNPFRQQKQ